jgi:cobalt/nickel transport system permease protein
MYAVSAAAIAYSVKKIKKDDLCEKKIPLMGVMGAFVFAAQMINFTIPATGSSGHIGGGILLAAMIGGFPALLSISAVLVIQCLFFADGGLLALGCNIVNLGVIPCLIVYPLIYRPLVKKGGPAPGRFVPKVPPGMTFAGITTASIAAVVAALQLGAFGVVLETQLSGIAGLPFSTFVLLMQSIHLVIGIMEGIITAAVLCFVYKMRPEIMESTLDRAAVKSGVPTRNVLIALTAATVLAGGVLSLFASAYPDGLEWALKKTAGMIRQGPAEPGFSSGITELTAKGSAAERAALLQGAAAFMPDYDYKNAGEEGSGTTVAGIIGSVFTFLLAGAAAFTIFAIKKKQRDANEKQDTGTIRA